MRLGKDLLGKPIISITDGRLLGSVKDIYVNVELYWLAGLYLKSEGLIRRTAYIIPREAVVVYGVDAILVKNSDVVTTDKKHDEESEWLRLDKLQGREVDTPGGTKVGRIGDVMLDENGRVTGFSLGKAYISGPIAEKGIIPRETLVDTGDDDGVMTVDLAHIEKVYQGDTADEEAINIIDEGEIVDEEELSVEDDM